MRHPSELFIVSLLVDQRSDSQVRNLVVASGLPPISDDALPYLAELRARVSATRPAGFTGARPEDRKFLREMNVDGLFHPDKITLGALQVLERPTLRRDVLLCFMGRLDMRDIRDHMSGKYDMDIDIASLRALRHYYFNVDIVDPQDWASLLGEDNPDSDAMTACLVGGPITAAYRIGLDRATNVKDVVYDVVSAVRASLHEIRDWKTTPEKIKMLSESMSTLARAHAVINTADQELAAVASELRQFKLSRGIEKPLPLALLSKEAPRALPAKEKTNAQSK